MAKVILFHGLTGEPAEVLPLAQALIADGHQVVTPLLPGHASSIDQLRQVTTEDFLQCAEQALIREVEAERGAVVVAGLSFGAVLALYLAVTFPALIKGAALLSCSLRFRSTKSELLLSALTHLPEVLINQLPVVKKTKRDPDRLELPRVAYLEHSVGALVRLVKIRQTALASAEKLRAPVLMLADPLDHHISPQGALDLCRKLPNAELYWVEGGEHQLTLGHRRIEVYNQVRDFIGKL